MTFDLRRTADPEFFQENRLPAHSDHRWFASVSEAAAADLVAAAPSGAVGVGASGGPNPAGSVSGSPTPTTSSQSSFERLLNGVWKFHYSPNLDGVPAGFEHDDFNVSTWDDIPVPAHIQMHGYDRPQYVNVQYPWDGRDDIMPGQIPTTFNPVASYVTEFTADGWLQSGERLSITFHGAESALVVWLNGTYVGYASDTFTPSEFDLTGLVRPGANRLAVQVLKWSGASWLEDQDFYRFSGIFRDVVLTRKPAAHVEDVRITSAVADDFASATVTVDLKLSGGAQVSVSAEGIGDFLPDESGAFTAHVTDPLLWSAEKPYLYRALIEVTDADGNLSEVVPVDFGIRRFEIEDAILKINGERVVFRGVNRHDFGLNGRVVTREEVLSDILFMKSIGINAVRTSHYPNNSFFYALCDQYGLYVIDEMNLETHGMWDRLRYFGAPVEEAVPGDKPEWLPALLDRAASMVERDKNHASVVIWSCGNESYGGTDILAVSDYFRSVDTRPVHYEGVHWDPRYPQTTDITSQMYTPAADVEAHLREHRDKPFILCEYAHAMGNSFGAVDKYLELAYREPLFQGGFIWDFADQAIAMTDRYGKKFFGYGGDNGEAPHDSDFCGNGILYADHTPKPFTQEVKYLYQGFKVTVDAEGITVENRLNFTSTAEYDCIVELAREGEVIAQTALDTDVAPGESATLPLPFTVPQDGEYTVTASFVLVEDEPWAPAGYEVAWGQGVFGTRVVVDAAPVGTVGQGLRVVTGIHNIGVHGSNFSVLFSKLQGGLQSYRFGMTRNGGNELLTQVPVPNFWHAPTSNELGWKGPSEGGQWLLASRYAVARQGVEEPRVSSGSDHVDVTFTYDLPTTPASTSEVTYRVHGTGRVEVTVTVTPGQGLPDMPEFGMLLSLPPEFTQLTWYGHGPEESYVDRKLGARLDVYSADTTEQLAQYLRPQESGSHTGVRWAEVRNDRGLGLRFEHAGEMEFSALPWTSFEVENANHHTELPPSSRTVVRPALMRRGVAGDNSWGARTHPEYLLPAGETLTFTFSFQGVM